GGLGILAGRGGILLHDLLLLRLLGGAGGIALLAHALAFRDPEILLGPGRGGDGDHGGQGDGDRQGSGGGLLHWGGPLQVSSVGPQAGCEPGPSRKRYQKTLPRRTPWGECPPSGQPQLGRFPAARACSKTGTNWLARLRSSLIRACGSGWVESHSGGREPPWAIMFSHRFTAARGSKPARAMSCWPTTSASLSWAREPGSRKPVWARMLPPCTAALATPLPKREPSSAPTSWTTPEAPAWRVMRSSWWWATTWPISWAITAESWSWLRATSKMPVYTPTL